MKFNKSLISRPSALLLAVAVVVPAALASVANAAPLSAVSVRFDRMQTSQATTGTVCAKPTSTATEAQVRVTFPTGYVLGTNTAFTTSTTNLAWPTGAAPWVTIGATATTVAGQVATFTSGDLVAATLYCFNWTSTTAVTVSASATANNAGLVETYTTTPTLIDSAAYSTASIANDQIVVTASVAQAFSFALSGNTDPLGPQSTGTVSTSPTPRTVTINTNAASGWNVWAKDATTGLRSPTTTTTIASTTPGVNSTLTAGTEGYNTGVTSATGGGTGTITVATPFVGGALGKGGGLNTAFATLATSSGTATNQVLTLNNNAAVSGSTPAATDYTDTITVVGAASF